MKIQILSSLLTTALVVSSNVSSFSSFEYKYQIKINSYSPLDESAGYYYKEKMIDNYEKYLFTLDSDEHTKFIVNNLQIFKLTDDAKVEYQMGTICITLGNGQGKIIKGKFRKNECDEKVIREKYYILELFQ